jgi:drug/metabolite transporter (DMT)-like permease
MSTAMREQRRAVVLILASFALLTGESAAVHKIGTNVSPLQLAFLRSVGSVVLVAALARHIGLAVFQTHHLGLQVTRGLLTVASIWAIFYGFAALPLADATAVSYTRGLFLTVLAAMVLREHVNASRWVATALGMLGGLIVIRPAFEAWRPDYLILLAGAGLNAGAMIATKVLERRDSAITVMAYMTVISLAASSPGAFSEWPGASAWPWMLAVMILGPAALYVGLLAIHAAPISVIAPLDYSRLIMAAVLGVAIFGEWPGIWDFLGAAIITIACVWAASSKPQTADSGWMAKRKARQGAR